MFRARPKPQEIILFWTYLKHFLEAGLPLSLAFNQLQLVLLKKPWPQLLKKIEKNLLQGKKLSASLAEKGSIFKGDVIEMIAIAEKKGNYPQIIENIIDSLKWQLQIKQTISNLISYPVILLITLILLLYIILGYVIPQLQLHLTSLGQYQLPSTTQLLVKMAEILPYLGAFCALITLWCVLSFKIKSPFFQKNRFFLEKHSSRIPVFGKLYNTLILINFIRMLAILLESGLDLLVSLHQSVKTVTNTWLANELTQSKGRLIRGEKLSVALSQITKSKPILNALIDLGERTGTLPQILKDHIDFEMDQFKKETERQIGFIQPTLIIAMGGFLIWVVLSILLPMYDHVGHFNL